MHLALDSASHNASVVGNREHRVLLLRLLLLRGLLFTWYKATQGMMLPTFLTGLPISVNLIKITLQTHVLSVDCSRFLSS